MSDETTAAAETDYAVRVSDRDGLVMQVSRRGIWVPPDIPTDECARRVLDALSPMIRYIIDHEVAMRMGVSAISPASAGGRDE